ncbi:putative amino acid permease 7 [Drosera capensis]
MMAEKGGGRDGSYDYKGHHSVADYAAAADGYVPLLADHDPIHRTGTIWTATAHIITAVIGAGVLSLAWSIAQLGWVAGPLALTIFAAITLFSTFLICDCYRSPDPEKGKTLNRSYMQAVKHYLGEKHERFCGVLVQESFYGCGIAYTITAAVSMRAIKKANCYHKEGHQASCSYGDNNYILLFGFVQIMMSQIPNFHNMEWLSAVAAIMSFSYAFISLGLGVAKVIGNGVIKGTISGVAAATTTKKLTLVFQALGDIAFAYPYSIIVLEIQDTLKSPPPENQTMKTASSISILITTFFYMCCGCFGYAAFGDDTPGNLLTGFGFYEPYWLIDFANACTVLHLVGGYQVYSQPVFAFVEGRLAERFHDSGFVNNFYTIKMPLMPPLEVNLLRLCFRTAYVMSTTALAMVFPYFNEVLGVLGALNFWPLAIYFPVEMYLKQRKVESWTRKGILLRTFSMLLLVVSVTALIGSVQGLLSAKLSGEL